MKKIIIFSVILTIILSCSYNKKRTIIKLENNLGIVSIILPAELDTFCKMFNNSGQSTINYCFANKKEHNIYSDKIKEFGKIDLPKDEIKIYSFTITQYKQLDKNKSRIDVNEEQLKKYCEKLLLENTNRKIIFSRNEIINNRNYSIVAYETPSHMMLSEDFNAITYINNQYICFTYQRYSKKKSDFIDRMYKSFKTVEIESN